MRSTESKYKNLISLCDEWIKDGKLSSVKDHINRLSLASVPRRYRADLAKICRRAGLIHLGLRLLHPVIRNLKEFESSASAKEICEYSFLLSRNGSIDEALEHLGAIDPLVNPEALLCQGFCYVLLWDYSRAAHIFEDYLKLPVDQYSRLVARVNLGASYLANGEEQKAIEFLSETISMAEDLKATRLLGNCLELRGQAYLLTGAFLKSKNDLAKAMDIFSQNKSYDQLFTLKWQSVLRATKENSTKPLFQFRAKALKRRHWESVRDSDFLILKMKFEQERFDHLVIGTSSKSYRERIEQRINRRPNNHYIIGDQGSPLLDLETGHVEGGGGLAMGKKIHQTISILTQDFYAPFNIGTLFSKLYPGEFFNVDSSPVRVRQLLARTRRWFEKNSIPVAVIYNCNSYKLTVEGPFSLKVPLRREVLSPQSLRWKELEKIFSAKESFDKREACLEMGLSPSNFHRLADWAMGQGLLERSGQGRSTIYKVA